MSSITRKQSAAAYLFIAPFFVVFVAMLVVPLLYSFFISLFEQKLIGGQTFVGLDNYVRAVSDPALLAGVWRVVQVLLIQVPIMLLLALVFALALDSGKVRGSKALRLLFFVPYAVPAVIAALMWTYLYGPDFGPIAQLFSTFGMPAPDFLSEQNVLGSIMNIVTWEFVGYNMVVMYAALRAIPQDQFEAAEIDGAGPLRVAWSIKIPAIRPAILLTVMFSIIGSFQLFNEPMLLRSAAPTEITGSFTPNMYAYSLAFVNQQIPYAAAVAFLLGLVIAIISYVVQLGTQRRERTEKVHA